MKYFKNPEKCNSSKTKTKRVSQGSSISIQNNRYNIPFEADKSNFSGSYGGGLLESSRLVTEDFGSPNQSKTFRDLSKYLNKSDNKASPQNKDLIHEQETYRDRAQPPHQGKFPIF